MRADYLTSKIVRLIRKQPDLITAGMKIVDSDLVIPSVCEVNFIAIADNNLLVLNVFDKLTAENLGKAAGISQWIYENAHILRHVYADMGLYHHFSPQILFLCSSMATNASQLLPILSELPLHVYNYQYTEEGLNYSFTTKKVPVREITPITSPSGTLLKMPHVELTPEELNAFFGPPARQPEVKNDPDFSGPYFV